MQAGGTGTVSFHGLTWAMPMVLWQLVCSVFPLCFLAALTFRLVGSYRMVPYATGVGACARSAAARDRTGA